MSVRQQEEDTLSVTVELMTSSYNDTNHNHNKLCKHILQIVSAFSPFPELSFFSAKHIIVGRLSKCHAFVQYHTLPPSTIHT